MLTSKLHNANKDEGDGIPCGEKDGYRVRLRSFHDRICDEPRGKSNNNALRATREASVLSHRKRLDKMANDPEILVSDMLLPLNIQLTMICLSTLQP